MDALSEAILRLLRRHDETDRRLARIEQALGIAAQPQREPEPPEPAAPSAPIIVAEPTPPLPPPLPPPAAPPSDRPRQIETTVGLTWISRIGALTLVFAVAFIFKYAIDNEWIGEAGRVSLGILAGLTALGIADRIWRSGQKTYAQAISGLGAAILYLSFYASFAFYHLVAQGIAFGLMALTTVLASALALRYDAPAIAALALTGGYLTPVLLSTGEDRPAVLFGYVLLLNAAAMALGHVRRWVHLETLASTATAMLYFAWFTAHFSAAKAEAATTFALLFYALFLFAKQPAVVLVMQFLVPVALAAIWISQPFSYLAASLAVVAAALIAADRRRWDWLPGAAFLAFWLTYAGWIQGSHPAPAPGAVLPLLTVIFLLFFLWVPWRLLVRKASPNATAMAMLGLSAAAYFAAAYHLLVTDYRAWLGLFAVTLACAYLGLGAAIWRRQPAETRDPRPVLLSLGVALTLITLAAPIQFTGYRITIGWAVEAAALAWIGRRVPSRRMSIAAWCVLALVMVRLVTIDAWIYQRAADYALVWNGRFITFLVAALSFWLSAYWIGASRSALVTYVAGHLAMVAGLGLEVNGWAERSSLPENLGNLKSTSISILLAAYALALVVMGVASRTRINRILGLVLIAIVVAKLYLYDVWELGRIYRIIAFAALGALLLVTSYLYSRYREKIESWWNDEQAAP